jgi:hypothetical protein
MTPTGIVRPFHEEDIPNVAELHRTVFGVAIPPSETLERIYRPYLTAFIPERTHWCTRTAATESSVSWASSHNP